jgi:hypothetical protein
VLVESEAGNRIRMATIFLTGRWTGAQARYDAASGELTLSNGEETLALRLEVDE